MYLVKEQTDCALALYLNNDKLINSHCPVTENTNTKNAITQRSLNHYLKYVIQSSPIECRYPCYTDCKTVSLQLALLTIPEGCAIFTHWTL